MGLEYKVNFTIKDLEKRLEIKDRDLQHAVEDRVRKMIQRIESGQNVDGSTRTLSPKYAEYKKKVGRNADPDMTLTGALLKSIQVTVAKLSDTVIEATVSFTNAMHPKAPDIPMSKLTKRGKARRKERKGSSVERKRSTIREVALGNQKRFGFFGFRAEDVEAIKSEIEQGLNK